MSVQLNQRARLVILKQRYDAAGTAGRHASMSPLPASFETEMVDLITRYKPKHKPHREWRLLVTIEDTLSRHFSTQKHRFSSPLTVPDANSQYWTEHGRDQVFGAQTGTYDHQWTGFSQDLLKADAPSVDKAIRWALWSAQQTHLPTTVLALPKNMKAPGRYHKHREVVGHIITTIRERLETDPDLVPRRPGA